MGFLRLDLRFAAALYLPFIVRCLRSREGKRRLPAENVEDGQYR